MNREKYFSLAVTKNNAALISVEHLELCPAGDSDRRLRQSPQNAAVAETLRNAHLVLSFDKVSQI
jgi:hypothetical protein